MVSFDPVREMLYIYLNYVTTLTSIRQNRSFSIVNGHKVDDQVLIPGSGRHHLLYQWVQINPGAHPVSCTVGTRGYFVKGMTKSDWTLLVFIPDTKF